MRVSHTMTTQVAVFFGLELVQVAVLNAACVPESKMINPEHSRKALQEQLDILLSHTARNPDEELPYEFLRDHSLAIVQLCNHLIDARKNSAATAACHPENRKA